MSSVKKNPFLANNGRYYTSQLFYERAIDVSTTSRVLDPVFTLARERSGLIPFGRKYVELVDPSGYRVTLSLLHGDFNHWIALMKCPWFTEYKEEWDKEIDAKLFAEGLDVVRSIQKDEDASPAVRLQAAKLLVQKGYKDKDKKPTRGRPSKEEVQGELKRQAESSKALDKDFERIQLVKR